jgi:NAD(P)-dependent dehydrogenase (short-subunit alcohol dehydrogenase family)
MRLAGKVALVTGAARRRGIGRGMVQALADEGAVVAVNDIAAAEAEGREFVDELQAKGVHAGLYVADVSDRSAVDALVGSVQADLGGSTSSARTPASPIGRLSPRRTATFDRIVAVNLTGAFNAAGRRRRPWSTRAGGAHHLYLARADGFP